MIRQIDIKFYFLCRKTVIPLCKLIRINFHENMCNYSLHNDFLSEFICLFDKFVRTYV